MPSEAWHLTGLEMFFVTFNVNVLHVQENIPQVYWPKNEIVMKFTIEIMFYCYYETNEIIMAPAFASVHFLS